MVLYFFFFLDLVLYLPGLSPAVLSQRKSSLIVPPAAPALLCKLHALCPAAAWPLPEFWLYVWYIEVACLRGWLVFVVL